MTSEYDALIASLRAFNEIEPPAPHEVLPPSSHEWTPRVGTPADLEGLPGTDYSRRGSWHELLARHGWIYLRRQGELDYWSRPGKTPPGTSATTGIRSDCGKDLLYLFSSNASPLEPDRSYSRFAVRALLEFGGNYSACARILGQEGYGTPRPRAPRGRGRSRRRRLQPTGPDTPHVFRTGRPGHYVVRSQVRRPQA
jgi:hypothetical protein